MEERPILIIAAMEDVELDILKDKLKNIKKTENNICTFYEGEIFEKNVVLCKSNIGIINATASLILAIEKYKPEIIINEGVAGGYGEEIHTGNIVIGTDAINITSYKAEKRKLGEGIKGTYELISFLLGEENHLVSPKADAKLVELAKKISEEDTSYTVHFGTIGSGDAWNKEADKIMYFNKKYGIMCEEMESVAIYTIANKYNIPCISIKGISNNEMLDEDYDETTGRLAQEFICRILSIYFA